MLLSGMGKQVVRCNVCSRVHDVRELLEVHQLSNGTITFICPAKKKAGTYKIESVGTLNPNQQVEKVAGSR